MTYGLSPKSRLGLALPRYYPKIVIKLEVISSQHGNGSCLRRLKNGDTLKQFAQNSFDRSDNDRQHYKKDRG